MDLDFYARVRAGKKRVTGKQPLLLLGMHVCLLAYLLLLFFADFTFFIYWLRFGR